MNEMGTATVLVCFLAWLLGVVVYRRYFSPLSDIPGPFWASFSRLWHLHITIQGNQNEQLAEAHEKYGHFVRLANNEVSVSHPQAVRRVLLKTLEKGDMYTMSTFPDWRYENPMSATNPKRKIALSKHFASGYALPAALRAEPAINTVLTALLDRLDAQAATAGHPMALDRFLTFTTLDLLGTILFSAPFGYLSAGADMGGSIATTQRLARIHALVCHFRPLALLALNPWTARFLPWGRLFRVARASLAFRRADDDGDDIVAHWLRAFDGVHDGDRRVLGNVTANIAAGSDTVSCALQSFVYHMARCGGEGPGWWARARAEMLEAQERWDGCQGRVVSYEDARRLVFLQACVKEALRIHCPVSMGLPRVAPAGGLKVGERVLPEGTTVSVSPWVVHRSREIWGADADEFNPERWLGPDAARLDKYWIPFGAGFMSCPGQHYAKLEISKLCATIVRDYDIRLVNPERPWKWHASFTMVPYDWPVYVTRSSP